jgi:hypothetical protein
MDARIKSNKLRINQLSEKAFQWYLGYLNTIDNRDIKSYVSYLSDDCTLQINNDPPVSGKDQITKHLTSLWTSFKGNGHDLLNIYGTDSSFSSEIINHFALHDGKEITVNAVGYLDRNGEGLLTSVRLYADFSPLFSKL